MNGSEIRSAYLDFFEQRGHRRVASGSVIPDGDPTLMFANAGMVQFKRVFTGEETREYSRAVTAQRCMRVSGKHNDLEEVGRSPSHQTMFEMLGNFSFGDYFKEGAIDYAWEFLTEVLKLDPDDLVVSVLHDDEEAFALWRDRIGLEERRIFRLDEKENFWQMGDTGPCGPCSEIHKILDRPAFEKGADPTTDAYVELWNLVFMQFDQRPDGERVALPKPCVDTGLGLERITSTIQGVASNYETDLFRPLLARAAELAGKTYGNDPSADISMQVASDHARACTFLIGDGVLPSNEGRGYVLRRVLRRAARHGVLLGVEEPFLYEMAGTVLDEMGAAYPEIASRREFIVKTIRSEEERFGRTLGRGLALLDEEIATARREKRDRLTGSVVFKLYDTFGFPTDLTEDILASKDLSYDRGDFDDRMREQSERARAAWKGTGQTAPPEVYGQLAGEATSLFRGYDELELSSEIVALLRDGERVESVSEGERVEVIARETPFYAESGGQAGDLGTISGPDGRIDVEDTQKPVDGLIVHHGVVALGRLTRGEEVTLSVDRASRAATVRNHSGTHLFHWALREVLGPQVTQAGSLVGPDRLRFDFTHDTVLSAEEVLRVEDLVNDVVLQNVPGRVAERSYDEAIADGAMAIFEEKYGDSVRVVSFGPSVELCGGTHARATGDIGCFRITGQSAIGAGVRRVEAQTGLGVLEHARRESRALAEAAEVLRAPPMEVAERVRRLQERQKELERELEQTRHDMRRGGQSDPMQQLQELGCVKLVAAEVPDANPKELRTLVDELKQRVGSGIVFVATRSDDRVALAMGVTKDLTDRFKAGALIKEVAGLVDGSGGGRPDFAQAGGTRQDGIESAIARVRELVEQAGG